MRFALLCLLGCNPSSTPSTPLLLASTPASAQEEPQAPIEVSVVLPPACIQWEVATVSGPFPSQEPTYTWTVAEVGDLAGPFQNNVVLPAGWEPVGGGDVNIVVRRCVAFDEP